MYFYDTEFSSASSLQRHMILQKLFLNADFFISVETVVLPNIF